MAKEGSVLDNGPVKVPVEPVLVNGSVYASHVSMTTEGPKGQRIPEFNAVVQARDPYPTTLPETILVLFGIILLGATIYLVFQFWRKKNRRRGIPTVYKLEGYRYSRLNQAELDVDNSLVYCRSEEEPSELEDELQCKPATLHVETNSLVNISNCTKTSNGGARDVGDLLGPPLSGSNSKLVTLDEASDEVWTLQNLKSHDTSNSHFQQDLLQ